MAGGTFVNGEAKIRPGTYFNVRAKSNDKQSKNTSGIVLLPFASHLWGPKGAITIDCNSPDAHFSELGGSVYDKTSEYMLAVREALKNASKVIIYNVTDSGTKATLTKDNLTATAMYAGSKGNAIRIEVAVPDTTGKTTVTIYFNNDAVESIASISTIDELSEYKSKYVVFSGSGELTAFTAANLTGGTDGNATVSEFNEFLDKSEEFAWNTLALPLKYSEDEASGTSGIFAAVVSKIKALNNDAGKNRRAYIAKYDSADFEQVVNVINGVKLDDGTEIPAHIAVAFEAGRDSSSTAISSFTQKIYPNAVSVIEPLKHEDAEKAIIDGKFFYSLNDDYEVVAEYDINSLVNVPEGKNETFKKNRVIRTINAVTSSLKSEFKPGKYDNDDDGWNIAEGKGASILLEYQKMGALKNVDSENDFKVDRISSNGDSMYFFVGIHPVDSADKLYFIINC